MRRVVDAHLATYLVGSVSIVGGVHGGSRPIPPRWLLVALLPCLVLALGGVLWLVG